jgi:transposase
MFAALRKRPNRNKRRVTVGEYVGFDVSKEATSYCVKDVGGKVLAFGKTASDPKALFTAIQEHCKSVQRVVMETGTLCHWLARALRALGLPVDLIDARQAHAVMKLQHNKTDANDADLLADIARTGFYRSVAVKSEEAQVKSLLLKARARLVSLRCELDNTIRGLLASLGHRFAKGVSKFTLHVRATLAQHSELRAVIEPLLSARAGLVAELAHLDKQVTVHAKADPTCQLLMSVPGVGMITALAYRSVIDDPGRFSGSRAVGAYIGLTARRNQSGEMDYSGHISKHGDGMLRSLLYEAASNMLTVTRRAHPLKDWARRLKRRSSHKKACVALARKLAVIMHRMLVTGEMFRWPTQATARP